MKAIKTIIFKGSVFQPAVLLTSEIVNAAIKQLRFAPAAFLALAVILLLVAGCRPTTFEPAGGPLPTPTPLPTPIVPEKPVYTVAKGTVVNALIFNGRVSPVVEEPLAFGKSGLISAVYVSQGDEVKAGDVLAELDTREIEKEILQAELALQKAIESMDKAERDHAEKILLAEINMRKAELEAQKAAAEQSSISELTQKQLDLQAAQEALGAAAQGYAEALSNAFVPQDYIDGLAHGLESAERALMVAEAEYNDALRKDGAKGIEAQINELDRMVKEKEYEKLLDGPENTGVEELAKAELALKEAREKLNDAQLTAPFDGRVLSVNIRKGGQAEPLRTVIVIAQIDELEITANLDATLLEKLSVGATAAIRLRNRPEKALTGTVRQLPYPYGGGSSGGPGDDRSVRIEVDAADVEFILGELAEVTVVLEEKENVLYLPPAAIRRFQGRRFAVVQTPEGGQQRVDVQIGIESADRVEILAGLEAGQVVIGE